MNTTELVHKFENRDQINTVNIVDDRVLITFDSDVTENTARKIVDTVTVELGNRNTVFADILTDPENSRHGIEREQYTMYVEPL